MSSPLEKEIEKNFEIVPSMWADAASSGIIAQLAMIMNSEPKGVTRC